MDADNHDWIELWPYAFLMIVLAGWAVYLFFAPTTWLEWVGAGMLQALIIAFYAEMYKKGCFSWKQPSF